MSDHGSSPRTFADAVVDITDLYAFASPERSGSLVLVLNVFPFAGPSALFSDGRLPDPPAPGRDRFNTGRSGVRGWIDGILVQLHVLGRAQAGELTRSYRKGFAELRVAK